MEERQGFVTEVQYPAFDKVALEFWSTFGGEQIGTGEEEGRTSPSCSQWNRYVPVLTDRVSTLGSVIYLLCDLRQED